MCQVNGENKGVHHYYSKGGHSPPTLSNTLGYSNATTSISNGVLNCSIRRKKTLIPASTEFFDISANKFYILFATGQFDSKSMFFL